MNWSKAVTHLSCFVEVPILNLNWDTNHFERSFFSFPGSLQANAGVVLHAGPQLLPAYLLQSPPIKFSLQLLMASLTLTNVAKSISPFQPAAYFVCTINNFHRKQCNYALSLCVCMCTCVYAYMLHYSLCAEYLSLTFWHRNLAFKF
jgi:hypothetical protein